jgi:hypothetical protein
MTLDWRTVTWTRVRKMKGDAAIQPLNKNSWHSLRCQWWRWGRYLPFWSVRQKPTRDDNTVRMAMSPLWCG